MPRDVSHAIPRKALESALASATYYSICIPLLNAFLPSIRNCFYTGNQHTMHVRLSPMAQRDCEWIKAIVWIVGNRPELIEKSIDCIGRINRTRFILETDASTEVGGGGILSDRNPDGSWGKILDTCVMRWHATWERPFIRTMAEWLDVASRSREMEAMTTDEWMAFEGSYYDPIQKPASINVLEY